MYLLIKAIILLVSFLYRLIVKTGCGGLFLTVFAKSFIYLDFVEAEDIYFLLLNYFLLG